MTSRTSSQKPTPSNLISPPSERGTAKVKVLRETRDYAEVAGSSPARPTTVFNSAIPTSFQRGLLRTHTLMTVLASRWPCRIPRRGKPSGRISHSPLVARQVLPGDNTLASVAVMLNVNTKTPRRRVDDADTRMEVL